MQTAARLAVAAILLLPWHQVRASPGPQPSPLPPPIPLPVDEPYPGAIKLDVDATDLRRHVFAVHETIPVAGAGDMILLYPEWLPGTHGPGGRADRLAGLVIRAGGQTVKWTRDTVNPFAFHVSAPEGAAALDVDFQFLSAAEMDQGRIVMTPDLLNLQWISMVLYPAGHFARQIEVEPSVKLPDGWHLGTALQTAATEGPVTRFAGVKLDTLVDSPIYAGAHFKRIDLDPGAEPAEHMNVFADREEQLEATPAQIDAHKALAQQIRKLFRSAHFDHYDLLLSVSDQLGFNGLEHLRSSENGTPGDYFTAWDKNPGLRDLMAHEWTHSWNGKFRRPADLWAADLNQPERDSLLWVYEGQTQYWGQILAARSGLWSKAEALDALALDAAEMEQEAGRAWRPLADTTNDPIFQQRRPEPWRNWQRGEDYYVEGALIWLEADTLIRQMSDGERSLDDFAGAFFGVQDGAPGPLTYTFDDVVHALNDVQAYDWAGFLHQRLDRTGEHAPLGGLAQGGYELTFDDTPNVMLKSAEGLRKSTDLTFSLGLIIGPEGMVKAVRWGGPAYQAGISTGGKIMAVNGFAYESADDVARAVKSASGGDAPIELLVKDGRRFDTVRIEYHDGLRYPHLTRKAGTPARIDDILAPLK